MATGPWPKEAGEQASKHARTQASRQASKQVSKPARQTVSQMGSVIWCTTATANKDEIVLWVPFVIGIRHRATAVRARCRGN